jgi:hypothetical protein
MLFVSHESVLPPTFQINGEGDEAPCRNDEPDIRAIDSRLFQVFSRCDPTQARATPSSPNETQTSSFSEDRDWNITREAVDA